MLGAVIGDIVGSIYEGRNHRSKDFPFFGEGATVTDDSVLTIAVADALLSGKPPARTLAEWARRYPGRGYGAGFAAWVRKGELAPYGSFGNGAAMRIRGQARFRRPAPREAPVAKRLGTASRKNRARYCDASG